MAKARGRTITKTTADVELDASAEHEALTPVMRRVADECWEIVRTRAAEQGLPIVKAWLWPYVDREDTPLVFLTVHFDAPREQVRAFHRGLDDERYRWRTQLEAEAQEASMRLPLTLVGLRRAGASVHGA